MTTPLTARKETMSGKEEVIRTEKRSTSDVEGAARGGKRGRKKVVGEESRKRPA